MDKFNRNYKLTIQSSSGLTYYEAKLVDNNINARLTPAKDNKVNNITPNQEGETALVVQPPFTIEINIERMIGSSNEANIRIYNLNEKTRAQLFKDRFIASFSQDGSPIFRKVILEAGYGNKLYPIFVGSLLEGYSTREGTEQITNLYCVSSAVGLYNTFINQSYNEGTTHQKVIDDTVKELSRYGDIEPGLITIVEGEHQSGTVALGEAFSVLNQYGVELIIDLGKVNVTKINQTLSSIVGDIPVISSETGLLNTPIRSGNYIIVNTILESSIRLGQLVELKSATAKYFNGQFKVYGISHKGIFSQTKEGKCVTTLKLWAGAKAIGSWEVLA